MSESTTRDGRRLRSSRNKQQIVQAMIRLIRAGDMNPSAASVAEEAGVGARTVFRHFEDMDALYIAMTEQIQAEVLPLVNAPFSNKDWKQQCFELLDRRAEIFERVMMIRLCAASRRLQSEYVATNYDKFPELEYERLLSVLPTDVAKDNTFAYAIDAALSFDVWRRLRQDRALSVSKSKEVMSLMVNELLASH